MDLHSLRKCRISRSSVLYIMASFSPLVGRPRDNSVQYGRGSRDRRILVIPLAKKIKKNKNKNEPRLCDQL